MPTSLRVVMAGAGAGDGGDGGDGGGGDRAGVGLELIILSMQNMPRW